MIRDRQERERESDKGQKREKVNLSDREVRKRIYETDISEKENL